MAINCPICKLDLSPLDLVSRTEHADLCVENGPAILEYDQTGQAVIKKNIPTNKQRKICPICDKTFQALHPHYKKCAIKNDILPDMMQDHWDKINETSKTSKEFPLDLLQSFIAQRVKEGRIGEQVEYAQALLLSKGGGRVQAISIDGSTNQQQDIDILVSENDTNQSNASASNHSVQQQVAGESMASATSNSGLFYDLMSNSATTSAKPRGRLKQPKKFNIQLVDEAVKRVNVDLRRERELAVSAGRRFDVIQALIEEGEKLGESSSTQQEDEFTINWLDRLT